jgi:hypothetical protein
MEIPARWDQILTDVNVRKGPPLPDGSLQDKLGPFLKAGTIVQVLGESGGALAQKWVMIKYWQNGTTYMHGWFKKQVLNAANKSVPAAKEVLMPAETFQFEGVVFPDTVSLNAALTVLGAHPW